MTLEQAIERAFIQVCERTGCKCFPVAVISKAIQRILVRRGFCNPGSIRRILFNMRKDGNNVFYENDVGYLCLIERPSIEEHFNKPKMIITTVITASVTTTITEIL